MFFFYTAENIKRGCLHSLRGGEQVEGGGERLLNKLLRKLDGANTCGLCY